MFIDSIFRWLRRVFAHPDPRFGGFWENPSVDELARRQGVAPVTNLDSLGGDWPEDESVDDFLDMVRKVRGG